MLENDDIAPLPSQLIQGDRIQHRRSAYDLDRVIARQDGVEMGWYVIVYDEEPDF